MRGGFKGWEETEEERPEGAVSTVDGMNRSVGYIENSGTIRDGMNRTVGRVESDGTVRDGMNRTIGRVESDGTVRDGMNRTIGSARGVKRTYAAVFFFFNMF